jgi:hypothetical protein
MKKFVILILLIACLFTACIPATPIESNDGISNELLLNRVESSEKETPIPNPIEQAQTEERDPFADVPPVVDVELREVSTDNGLISIKIPIGLDVHEEFDGTIYTAYGYLKDAEGDEQYCRIYITQLYQVEEPQLDYEMMDKLVEFTLILFHGQNMKIERIKDITLSDSSKGYCSYVKYPSGMSTYSRYLFNIQSEGIYYNINIISPNGLINNELALDIFNSVSINTDIEKDMVKGFKLNIKNNIYNSWRAKGVSMEIPPNWNPTESTVFNFSNSILGMTSEGNIGSISVRKFNKESSDISNALDFYMVMVTESINAGFIDMEAMADIEMYTGKNGRAFCAYPTPFTLVQWLIEYENDFYCIDFKYYGNSQEEFSTVMAAIETFKAPGKEILSE